jgi:hypothetical protein
MENSLRDMGRTEDASLFGITHLMGEAAGHSPSSLIDAV